MQKTWIRVLTTMITLGMMIVIFAFSSQPAEESDLASDPATTMVADLVEPEWREWEEERQWDFYQQVKVIVRKVAHFTEYAILGASLRLCLESWLGERKRLNLISWILGALYAASDEIHQTMVPGRSGEVADVLLDSCGVLFGAFMTAVILRKIREKLQEKKAESQKASVS